MMLRRWLLGVALCVLCTTDALTDNYRWSSTGPVSGWLRQMVSHPTRPGEIYAVSYFQGLYKSTDSGETWSILGQGNRDTGEWIAMDPADPDTFYVASYQSVLVTHDGGTTFVQWPTQQTPVGPTRVAVSSDGSIIYAIGTN